MGNIRESIVQEARRWVGTPYAHQAALLGVGCDCVGLIRGVGFACDVLPQRPEEWKLFNAYGRLPSPKRMAEGMRTFLIPVGTGAEQPGDIAWLAWRADLPMHLAILAESNGRPTLIHSYSDVGRVVEHGLSQQWSDRVVSWWRYPGADQ